jgi:hypothetical protein
LPDSRSLPPGRTAEQVLATQLARLAQQVADLRSTMLGRPNGASGGDSTWTAPTLTNSWVNYGGAQEPAGYRKDASGFVHLRGFIKNGSVSAAAFTLPAGYRPAYDVYAPVVSSGAFGYCIVTQAGLVMAYNGSSSWFSFAGITFLAEQ